MPKVLQDCIGFDLLLSVIDLENSRHFPIRCKTETNRDLATRVFPRLRLFTCIYFEFSLALGIFTSVLIGRCDSVLQHSIEKGSNEG